MQYNRSHPLSVFTSLSLSLSLSLRHVINTTLLNADDMIKHTHPQSAITYCYYCIIYFLYLECSPLRMHKLWRPRHTHALAVGTEVEFYCLSHPALQTHVLKCNQNGAWRITHETKENIQRCRRYGKQDVTQHV